MAIERRTVAVMAAASAVSVANLYYCQPLLSEIARSLGVPDSTIGYLPMWTQAGTALGMLAFVPLGDMFPRRKLIVLMCGASATTIAVMALAPNLTLELRRLADLKQNLSWQRPSLRPEANRYSPSRSHLTRPPQATRCPAS